MARFTAGPLNWAVRAATAVIAMGCVISPSPAKAADVAASSLGELVRARKGKPAGVDPEAARSAHKRLATAVAKLSAFLMREGKNGAAWERYLRLDDLAAAMRGNAET